MELPHPVPSYFFYCQSCGQVRRISQERLGDSVTCKGCGRSVVATEENTVPAEEDGASILNPPSPQTSVPRDEQEGACARCGRAFRGAWDMHETSEGVLCNICANSATSTAVKVEPKELTPYDNLSEGMPSMYGGFTTDRNRADGFEPSRSPFEEKMQRVAIVLAVFVLLTAAVFLLFDPSFGGERDVYETPAGSAAAEPEFVITPLVGVVVVAVRLVSGLATYFLALYLLLLWTNNLPNDTLSANIIAVGAVSVLLSLVGLVPCIGLLIVLYIAYSLYGLSFFEVILFFVLLLLSEGITWLVSVSVLGTLGLLVT